jgi:6-phosphogluconolactonase
MLLARFRIAVGIVVSLTFAGCGGGGGGSGGGTTAPPPVVTFTVSGTVNGLAGTGLVLQINGGSNLNVAQSGSFSFPPIASGGSYNVTVLTQPTAPVQACTVANGSGTITSNVANVVVSCVTNAYTIGGTVSNLAAGAAGLVLTNNGGDQKTIDSNGAFVFLTPVASGGSYDIRVLSQPYDPYQTCTVDNGTGAVTNSPITAPAITCTTLAPRFATSLDSTASTYSQYAVDPDTGQLRMRAFARVGLNPNDLAAYGFDSKISFVLSRGSGELHAFARNNVTGQLIEAPGSPQATGAVPSPGPNPLNGAVTITLHPKLNFIYVANGGANPNVAGFTFDTTSGALAPMPGSPFPAGARPVKLVIEATGRFAYVVNRDDNTVTSYSIDQTSGALAAMGAAIPTGATGATFPTVHPSGKYLYVPNGSGSISGYSIGATGALTPIANSPFTIPGNLVASILIHPNGKFLYIKVFPPQSAPGSIAAVAIDQATGALSMIGSPVGVGPNPINFSLEPSGRYMFVASRGIQPYAASNPGSISVLRVNASTGELTSLPGVDNLTPAPYSVSLDSSGKYLYSASVEGNLVRTYAFNMTTAVLTPSATGDIAVRGGPLTLLTIPSSTASPAKFSSKFAYVPNNTASSISAFSINASSGALTAATGVGTSPAISGIEAVAVSRGTTRLIALNAGAPQTVRAYPINAQSGALGVSSTAASAGTTPLGLVAEPSGRFAYSLDLTGGVMRGFSIDRVTGNVTALASIGPTLTGARALAIHPSGRFLYYITATHWGLQQIDPSNGALSTIADAATAASNNLALAIHPSGRFAYITRGVAGAVDTYRITTDGLAIGQLTAAPSVGSLGNDPFSIAIDPTGRFLYVANNSSNNIAAFRVTAATGALTAIGAATNLSAAPQSVRVDYSGKFLYAVVGGSQVLTFAIDSATGALTATSPTGPATEGGPRELALSEDVE